MSRWIQMWYSWGDQETPIEAPVGVDPWEKMKQLAIDEAEVAFFEHEDEGEIGLQFYPEQRKIILHYQYDDTYCYYMITDTEDFTP